MKVQILYYWHQIVSVVFLEMTNSLHLFLTNSLSNPSLINHSFSVCHYFKKKQSQGKMWLGHLITPSHSCFSSRQSLYFGMKLKRFIFNLILTPRIMKSFTQGFKFNAIFSLLYHDILKQNWHFVLCYK